MDVPYTRRHHILGGHHQDPVRIQNPHLTIRKKFPNSAVKRACQIDKLFCFGATGCNGKKMADFLDLSHFYPNTCIRSQILHG